MLSRLINPPLAIFLIITVANLLKCSSALSKEEDYYTSLVGLQNLAKSEQTILHGMLDYRKKLETRLDFLNSYLAEYKDSVVPVLKLSGLKTQVRKSEFRQSIPVFEDEEDLKEIGEIISGHPLLAFRLLRRFGKELPELMLDMQEDIETDFEKLIEKFTETMRVPNQEDLEGAADGLIRIQDSYAFEICDFINGTFNDVKTNTGLKAFDLNYVGVRALVAGNFLRAIEWYERAFNRVAQQGDTSVPIALIGAHLQDAIVKHNNALEEYGSNENVPVFAKPLSNNLSYWKAPTRPKRLEKKFALYHTEEGHDDTRNFRALCSGRSLQPESTKKDLNCWYKKDTPWTVLSPFKMELHHKNPPVVQIYDLISDRVISQIIQAASPYMARAKVLGSSENRNTKSDLRTSASTWVVDPTNDMVNKVPRLIYEVTGLNAKAGEAAEDLQISSYGAIGGHYSPHFDALFDEMPIAEVSELDRFRGDRIATVMFYLSDVKLGGGTAFPRLGLATKATKGSALFWYNLKKDGKKDKLTLHGGCPVVYGNKWVANKWIRSTSQMSTRPCGLTSGEE